MVSVCFYFQVHQPFRLKPFQVFDIGTEKSYFDAERNKAILQKVAAKCYLPANNLLLELLQMHPEFKISFSLSGVFLEQCEEFAPEVIRSFQQLVATGQVEILAETYHHSLSFLYSDEEFAEQIQLHQQKIQELFGVRPIVFRNTELIFNNKLAATIERMGFKAVLLEGWDPYLEWRSPNFLYRSVNSRIPLLLKNYRLSDDVAFRFSDKGWQEYPLTVEKYVGWINAINGNGYSINLFMDYETFGEHQWESTGIFEFLRHLPNEILKNPDNNFKFPSEVAQDYPLSGTLDIHHPISWADTERDVSAWLGNAMQRSAIELLYSLERPIKESGNLNLLRTWRKLQTSDHFYYMCTKWFNDGDVHKYFNPYDSPYDGFIYFMNVLKDLQYRLSDTALQATLQTTNEVK